MFLTVLFVLPVTFISFQDVSCELRSVDDDSYWRELHGDIPIDALPGGLTSSNSVTYVGEITHANTLWFGDVSSSGRINFLLYTNVVSESRFVKILCTKHPERFSWRRVTNKFEFRQINKERLISSKCGGSECYVGRAHYHNNVVVGTVSTNYVGDPIFEGATGGGGFETITFQVLYYNQEEILNTATRQNESVLLLLLLIFLVYIFR